MIEWWYFNAFVKGAKSGKQYAIVGSFFRTGLPGGPKGHYLIYSLADLDAKTKTAYSVLDRANLDLLKGYLTLARLRDGGNEQRAAQLQTLLQKGELPKPHRVLDTSAVVSSRPGTSEPFAITMGANALRCVSADGRTWRATLQGDDFALDLTLRQPAVTRPAMRVGGAGKTGLDRPDDMFYVSLTRMTASGTLARNGNAPETVTGEGWLDRQWGTSWVVQDTGWDWFGVQLNDGSDLIVYQIRDNKTGCDPSARGHAAHQGRQADRGPRPHLHHAGRVVHRPGNEDHVSANVSRHAALDRARADVHARVRRPDHPRDRHRRRHLGGCDQRDRQQRPRWYAGSRPRVYGTGWLPR
jgi:hypothetical protein